MTGEDTLRTSLTLPESLNRAIECKLEYGDDKAAWIRQACRQRLECDGASEK